MLADSQVCFLGGITAFGLHVRLISPYPSAQTREPSIHPQATTHDTSCVVLYIQACIP
jgi:hypothetical protein